MQKFSLLASLCLANQIFDVPSDKQSGPEMAINRDFIDEIKAKTDKWTPMEFEENPFRHRTKHQFKQSLGTRHGGSDLLKAAKKAKISEDIINQLEKIADISEIKDQI